MRKPTFPERSAHLSYVAPLIGVIIVLAVAFDTFAKSRRRTG